MNIIEAYEYLAPKLSLSEREVLDVIYKSAGVDKPLLSDVLAEIGKHEFFTGEGDFVVDMNDVREVLSKYFT